MRYWQHNETGRLLKIDLQMAPSNWTEITEEEYNLANKQEDFNGNMPSDDSS